MLTPVVLYFINLSLPNYGNTLKFQDDRDRERNLRLDRMGSVHDSQGCSRAWMEADGVHSLLSMKSSVMYALCMFMTLQ